MFSSSPSKQTEKPAFTKPRHEVAEIFQQYGDNYRQTHRVSAWQKKVMFAIENCRTSALGGHIQECDHCHAQKNAYNSCRNRHCPKLSGIKQITLDRAKKRGTVTDRIFSCSFYDPAPVVWIIAG